MNIETPNYTQIPNQLLGDIERGNTVKPGLMAELEGSELKVYLAVCRMTVGFHQAERRASLSMVQDFTGLSKQGVLNASKRLEEMNLISRNTKTGVTLWQLAVNSVDNQDSLGVNSVDRDGQLSRPPSKKETKKKLNTTTTNVVAPPEKQNPKIKQLLDKATVKGIKILELSPGDERQFLARAKHLNGSTGEAIDAAISQGADTVSAIVKFVSGWNPPPQYFDETGRATSKHPAVCVYRSEFQRYPRKNVYDDLATTVGVEPDKLEFWRQVVKAWKLSPYAPTNYAGMIDCFKRGELPSTKGNQNGRKPYSNHNTRKTEAELASWDPFANDADVS